VWTSKLAHQGSGGHIRSDCSFTTRAPPSRSRDLPLLGQNEALLRWTDTLRKRVRRRDRWHNIQITHLLAGTPNRSRLSEPWRKNHQSIPPGWKHADREPPVRISKRLSKRALLKRRNIPMNFDTGANHRCARWILNDPFNIDGPVNE